MVSRDTPSTRSSSRCTFIPPWLAERIDGPEFADVFARDSHDGAGSPVSLTVHYGRSYNYAFWDGTQLVFGDGDGRTFERFTKPVDVLAHEFGHGVIEHTADTLDDHDPVCVPEHRLTAGQAELARRILRPGSAGD